jgi:hypothetical protein
VTVEVQRKAEHARRVAAEELRARNKLESQGFNLGQGEKIGELSLLRSGFDWFIISQLVAIREPRFLGDFNSYRYSSSSL